MNRELITFVIGSGWLGLKILATFLETAGKSWYELRLTNEQLRFKKSKNKKKTYRPSISVIVYAYNAERTIEECLESIISSRYPKFKIVVIDNGSTDKTQHLIRRFIKTKRRPKIKLVTKHSRLKETEIALPAKTVTGELEMRINAAHRLDKQALDKIVVHFAHNTSNVLVPAVRSKPHKSLIGVLQQFEYLRRSHSAFLGLYPETIYAVMRKKPLKNTKTPTYYADDVLLIREPHKSYRKLFVHQLQELLRTTEDSPPAPKQSNDRSLLLRSLSIGKGAVLFLEPLIITYFLYLALNFERPEPLALTWGINVFALMFYAWSDRHASFSQKFRLITLAPVMYPLIYALLLTRLAMPFAVIFNKLRSDWEKWQYVSIQA